jgi:cell division protein FtsZ
MLEVQEAAKIITESVDKDAKIIFGIATDPTLKKDEIKVTVIATGFPSGFSNRARELSSEPVTSRTEVERPEPRLERTETVKDVVEQKADDKRIDLEMNEGETKLVEDKKTTPVSSSVPTKKPSFKFDEEEDDDDWEALPPFLRRKK